MRRDLRLACQLISMLSLIGCGSSDDNGSGGSSETGNGAVALYSGEVQISSGGAFDFGSVDLSTKVSSTAIFTLKNAALSASQIEVSGTNALEFVVGAVETDAAGNKTFQITFTPSSAGDKRATITLRLASVFQFAVQGRGETT